MSTFTRQALSDSLVRLLNSRPLRQITVKEIVNDCGVNRQTFYYHFQDIYDLLFWTMEERIARYYEDKAPEPGNTGAAIRTLFGFFRSNSRMIRHAYDPVNRMLYETLFREKTVPLVAERLRSYPEAEHVAPTDLDFLTDFYVLSIGAFLARWIEEGMPDEDDVRLEKYIRLVEGGMNALLQKFQK